MKRKIVWILLVSLFLSLTGCDEKAETIPTAEPAAEIITEPTPEPTLESSPAPTPKPYGVYEEHAENAATALLNQLEDTQNTLWVYKDYSSGYNRFTQKSAMGNHGSYQKEMNENWQEQPYAGKSCIRCEQLCDAASWGGWMFFNGYIPENSTSPALNNGSQDGQGQDLSGAETLRFYARGEQGGETVEFFTAGFGYNGETGEQTVAFPDSCHKQSLGYVTLSDCWEEYSIDLSHADMSYIVCGFGYVLSGAMSGAGDSVFYLDEIRFEGKGVNKAHILLCSYETDNQYLANTAYSYDNAISAMALMSQGYDDAAMELLDAFVYAVIHDRYASGCVRNAYSRGGISSDPGWGDSVRLPGWYDAQQAMWCEDRYQVGCNTGITAYVALALLQGYRVYGDEEYLDIAEQLMDWVIANCSDENPGFTAGYDGWPESGGGDVYPFSYKSIEHNIDAYAAFRELSRLTQDESYTAAAESALGFIRSMYNPEMGCFYTGTGNDGVTVDSENLVLDAQVWCALALGEDFAPYERALTLVAEMRNEEGAYPFCVNNENGGWWSEGTAFTALLLRTLGEDSEATATLDTLASSQLETGLFPAASTEHLSTGIWLFTGEPWEHDSSAHIAPAAWFIMAVNNFNPYYFN